MKAFISSKRTFISLILLFLTSQLFSQARLLKDVNPGTASSIAFGNFYKWGDTVYYTGNDGTTTQNCFMRSDGTAEGTYMIKNFYATTGSAFDDVDFYLLHDSLIFFNRTKLYKSDGTDQGTVLVKTNVDADRGHVYAGINNIYFKPSNTASIWKSNGTSSGTNSIVSLTSYGVSVTGGMADTAFMYWTHLGLSKIDNSAVLKQVLGNIIPRTMVEMNGKLYFPANNSTYGIELWVTDGTTAGSQMIMDINPGAAGSLPMFLTNINGTLYFVANDGINGDELWTSDGTASGTKMVKDIRPSGSAFSTSLINNPWFTYLNGYVYFKAFHPTYGSELWRTDGTEAGTTLVKDINPGASDSYIFNITKIKNSLYFKASHPSYGNEIWKTDGTEGGTILAADIIPGTSSGLFNGGRPDLFQIKDSVYFMVFHPNYGAEIFMMEDVSRPVVTTTTTSNISFSSVTLGGNVLSDYGYAVTERGICYSTTSSPTIANNKTNDGSGVGAFSSLVNGLSPNTTYYVRAYAINSEGIAYGNQISFKTAVPVSLPSVSTTSISDIKNATASGGGNINNDGGATVSKRGICWSTLPAPTIVDYKTADGTGTGIYSSSLSGLIPSTTYYVRAYATNSEGTAYGNEVAFSTIDLPTITTTPMSEITSTTAVGGGNITNDGGSIVTAKGVCWSTSTNPTIIENITTDGSGTGSFISTLSGLTSATTYYVRSYATNNAGTIYGNEEIFTTSIATGLANTSLQNNISIYPNPGNGIITIDINSLNSEYIETRILNNNGIVVYSNRLNNFTGNYNGKIDLGLLSKGFYAIQIITSKGIFIDKLIISQ